MKFSWLFLKEFLDLKIRPQDLASLLTLAGLEVSSCQKENSDFIFEGEVTSNRTDLLSIVGIAYEAAALLGKKVKLPPGKIKTKPILSIPIEIEDERDCPFYVARVVKGIKVGPSPSWLKQRLLACGINSVNNVVDVTNYCMLKWGQPLHAFDLAKIEEKIVVRKARIGEKLICLDNKERELNKDILVIADKSKVLALGGIIGGKSSEVNEETKEILIEAAIFSPLTIRRGRRFLGIETESSYRFERSINPFWIEKASSEAAELITNLAEGRFSGYKKVGKKPILKASWIKFDHKRMNHFLGTDISKSKALKILKRLNFRIEKKKKGIFAKIPPFRSDISLPEDLFEEVARIWGYQNIQESLPAIRREIEKVDSFYRFKEKVREKLVGLGFKEIITFSILKKDFLSQKALLNKDNQLIKVVNPLRSGENILRTSIFLGIIQTFRHNLYRKRKDLEFFEIANSFSKSGDSFKETPKLSLGFHSENIEDFYIFKAKLEAFFKELGIEKLLLKEKENPLFSNFSLLSDYGWLGVLDYQLARKLDLEKVFLGEFDLEKLFKNATPPIFKEISYFPWVERDISLAKRQDIRFKEIEEIIKNKLGGLLKNFEIIDIYRGEKLPQDFIGFTLRIFYQHKERTLEAKEVDSLHFKLREALSQKEGIILR